MITSVGELFLHLTYHRKPSRLVGPKVRSRRATLDILIYYIILLKRQDKSGNNNRVYLAKFIAKANYTKHDN
jgi:hypothetical protein